MVICVVVIALGLDFSFGWGRLVSFVRFRFERILWVVVCIVGLL